MGAVTAAFLAACSQQEQQAKSSPSARASTSPAPATDTTLGVFVHRTATVDITAVEVKGLSAKVVATARLRPRSGGSMPFCPPPTTCTGAIDPPYVSTTRDKIFVLDGDSEVKELPPGGALRAVTTLGGTASVRAAFAISPDDRRIAVALLAMGAGVIGAERIYVEDLLGGNRVTLTLPPPLVYWPVGWRQETVVFAGGAMAGGLALNPYGASEFAIVDPRQGGAVTRVSSANCSPTGLLTAGGTACVSDLGAQCLGQLVSHVGNSYYYGSCLHRLDWTGKETVFLLPNNEDTRALVGDWAALSPDGRAIVTRRLFLVIEPDAQGRGGNQFFFGAGVASSSAPDVGWLDAGHVAWNYRYSDGTEAQRIIQLGADYASVANVVFDGFPVDAGAPRSPVAGVLAGTVPEAL